MAEKGLESSVSGNSAVQLSSSRPSQPDVKESSKTDESRGLQSRNRKLENVSGHAQSSDLLPSQKLQSSKQGLKYAVTDDDDDEDEDGTSGLRLDDAEVDRFTSSDFSIDNQNEMEEYFCKLTYYVASEPEGELSSEHADELLEHLCTIPLEQHRMYIESIHAIAAIVTVMQRATGITTTQILACYAVRSLLRTVFGEEECVKKGVAMELVHCYHMHEDPSLYAELHIALLVVLCDLACSQFGQAALTESRAEQVIIGILKTLPMSEVDGLKWGCGALAFFLVNNKEGQKNALDAESLPLLISFLDTKKVGSKFRRLATVGRSVATGQRQPDGVSTPAEKGVDPSICSLVTLALARLLQYPDARSRFLSVPKKASGVLPGANIQILLACMQNYIDVFEISRNSVTIVLELLKGSDPAERPGELEYIQNSGIADVITNISSEHAASAELAHLTEQALAQLSTGIFGWGYHSLLAGVSALRLWQSNGNATEIVSADNSA